MSDSPLSPPRSRGRPHLSEADVGKARERLVAATRAVFARVGYHGLSVELVLAEAGVSRPTFYKFFPSLDEVVDLLLVQVNTDLVNRLVQALAGAALPMDKVEAAILAWRQWGEDLGEFLRPFYAELHNLQSPVGQHRQRTIGLLAEQIALVVQALGRERPSALRVATFLNGVEFLGYHYHLNTPRDDSSWNDTRTAMFRLAIGLLGNESDWGNALGLAQDLHIDLKRS